MKGDLYKQLMNIYQEDTWCPNCLCSKERAVAIDFQLVRCATNLAYCIFLCSNLCYNKNDFVKAVDIYYSFVTYYLKDLGLNPEDVFTR